MKKKEFFLRALKTEAYRNLAWIISIFAITNEDKEAYKKDPYPYRVVQTPTNFFFVDPEKDNELTLIEDSKPNQPLFTLTEKIELLQSDTDMVLGSSKIETQYGRLILNYIVIYYPFKKKLPFINEKFTPATIEKLILPRFKDTPEEGTPRNEKDIYVDEYLVFCDAVFFTTGLTQISVPGITAKSIVGAPGIREFRDKLIAENKDNLDDPSVIAGIDAKLVAYDKNYLKDDPSSGFLIDEKSFKVVRKRLYGMYGAEAGFDEGTKIKLIGKSLSEGWDKETLPTLNNASRVGSYNRGFQTQLGGEAVKWLLRASSNISIIDTDCGTKLGIPFKVTMENLDWLVGFSVVGKDGPILVKNTEEAKQFFNKEIIVRSPMFCKLTKTDYCKVCVGERLAANPQAASVAISEYGSTFLGLFMAAMHGKELAVAHMNYKEVIF